MSGTTRWALASLAIVAFITATTTATATAGRGTATSPEDDPEERAVRGRQIFQNNCLMCHSIEIYGTQRMAPAQWQAEITKMVGWGSPVTAEEQPFLLDYLSATYGANMPPARPGRMTIAEAEAQVSPQAEPSDANGPDGDPSRGGRLYAEHCASCHGKDGRGGEVGTNLVEKPILTRHAEFREVLRAGRNKMPAYRAVLNPQAEDDLLAWLSRLP